MYKALLKKLDEAGSQGLDLSPGDPVAKEAAAAIRSLLKKHTRTRYFALKRAMYSKSSIEEVASLSLLRGMNAIRLQLDDMGLTEVE